MPYRSLLPQEVDNLLVPVAISASHVGWGSIRLEPVWMQLGEAAGFAAALAVQGKTTPAALSGDVLLHKLVSSQCMVSFFNDVDVTAKEEWNPAVQFFGTKGFFHDYNARAKEPLKTTTAHCWVAGFARLKSGKLEANALAREVAKAEGSESGVISLHDFAALVSSKNEESTATNATQPITRGEALRILFSLLP